MSIIKYDFCDNYFSFSFNACIFSVLLKQGLLTMNMIRCPHCRGTKKVPKLGGIIGECDSCNATGKISVEDRPNYSQKIEQELVGDIIKQVADSVPIAVNEVIEEPLVKVDTKRTLYRQKKG